MRTIHKFPIENPNNIQIELHPTAEILDVQTQDGVPCVWALIPDTEAPKVFRTFKVYGTGHSIIESSHRLSYVGTFQMDNLVWHLFEVG